MSDSPTHAALSEHDMCSEMDTDILIIGAGPVGMTLALLLKQAGKALSTHLVDLRPRGAYGSDPRALALSQGTRQLLEPLGAWNAAAGTPIHDIHISQRGGFGRTHITREEMRLPSLGHVMRYRDLAAALDARLPAEMVIDSARLQSIQVSPERVKVTLQGAGKTRVVNCRLLVHAEGTPGDDPDISVRDYQQHAVLAEVRPEPGHQHRAWERFTPDGPLALLPLGEDYSLVFTAPPAKADALMSMNDQDFLHTLEEQFGKRSGLTFRATSPRARFPLSLRLRRSLFDTRQVWIGNTAQTLHPVSGQGFNLGIRDAWVLAKHLLATTDPSSTGTARNKDHDPGAQTRLAAYAQARRLDRTGSAAFTDGIVRIFSNDFAPLRTARGLGLLALDLCSPAKRFVAKRMIWGSRSWP